MNEYNNNKQAFLCLPFLSYSDGLIVISIHCVKMEEEEEN